MIGHPASVAGIDIGAFLAEQLSEELPDAPWLLLGRSGGVYRLIGYASREAALADCAEWAFESDCLIDRPGTRFYPIGSAPAPEAFSAEWFVAWFLLDPDLAELAVTRARARQPRRWELDELSSL